VMVSLDKRTSNLTADRRRQTAVSRRRSAVGFTQIR
jgi:hypothetical protein